jgi:hypothetical protein
MASGGSSKSKFTKAFTKRAAKTSVPRVLLGHGETFAKTREGKTGRLWSRPSRHGTSRILKLPRAGTRLNACLNLPKPARRVAPLNTRAGQIRQDALAQGVSPMVARYPNSSQGYSRSSPQRQVMARARGGVLAMVLSSFLKQKQASPKQRSNETISYKTQQMEFARK